jgi:hypothetical protein
MGWTNMDAQIEQPWDIDATGRSGPLDPAVEQTSTDYLGRWNRLVSTTNWEKGRIIVEWREALVRSGSPAQACSDDAWARRVGNISSQHVGRLRRVWARFAAVADQFSGLYWSHFQAALDWHDAEMWLEGAALGGWSVAAMREKRWDSMGAAPEQRLAEPDMALPEIDEDADPQPVATEIEDSLEVVRPAEEDGAQREAGQGPADPQDDSPGDTLAAARPPAAAPVRPFENLPPLPDDLSEALESLKLAIVSHRLCRWRDVSADAVLAVLEGLRQLVLAPLDTTA